MKLIILGLWMFSLGAMGNVIRLDLAQHHPVSPLTIFAFIALATAFVFAAVTPRR